MGPSRAQLLGADPTAVAVRNLIQEVEALPQSQLPDGLELTLRNPVPLMYRTKEGQKYDADMRRARFIERAREMGLDQNEGIDEGFRARLSGTTEDEIRALKSAFEPYGQDWPIYNAGRWISSLPGAVYATGQMVANEVDPVGRPYPQAYDDFAKNMNNLAIFAEPFGKNMNHMRDMQDMRDEMARKDWQDLFPDDAATREQYRVKSEPKTGREMLEEAKVDELIGKPATAVLGGTMDATIDPMFYPGKSWAGFLFDYGLGSAHETLPVAVDAIRAAKELARPSKAYYY